MKQLIEDLISALEYHVEQTRPVHMTTVAIQAAKDALKAMSAAPVQEPVAWVDWLPEGTTHIAKCKATTSPGGSLSLRTRAFKYEADVLKVYTTDNDDEYPEWRAAKDVFYHLNFAIVPLYTTPPAAPVQEPVTEDRSRVLFERHWRKTRGPKKSDRELTRHPLQPQTYIQDSANRHWVTWQAALKSTPPAAPYRAVKTVHEGKPVYVSEPTAQPAPVQVSPLEFVTMVLEKEHLVGKPLVWAEWPNKE